MKKPNRRDIRAALFTMVLAPLALLYMFTEWKWIERAADWLFDRVVGGTRI